MRYNGCVERGRWVLLAYRLPREPSSPRTAVWRRLRRLGAAWLLDGLVALPLSPQNREHLEWLADEVHDNGGEATVWLAEPAAAVDGRRLEAAVASAIAEEYRAVTAAARVAHGEDAPARRRTLARLRRELRRIRARDHFPPPERAAAEAAVEELAEEAGQPLSGSAGQPDEAGRQGRPTRPDAGAPNRRGRRARADKLIR